MKRIVVVGDALLDRDVVGTVERVCPDAPVPVVDVTGERLQPGGAGRTAAMLAADGVAVTLVTALGDDEPGTQLRRLLEDVGVSVVDLGCAGETGEKVRIRSAGQSLLRFDRGAVPGAVGQASAAALEAIALASAVVVSDYGRGVAAAASIRASLVGRSMRRAIVWDPHPRGAAPVRGVTLATPNDREATALCPPARAGDRLALAAAAGQRLARQWEAVGVAVTLGSTGALLCGPAGAPLLVPATPTTGGDACGAGDRFAATAAIALATGALVSEAVELAVASASQMVAAAGDPVIEDGERRRARANTGAAAVVAATRERGGRVVATGGCFDLLHPGHIATLRAARGLGDCLIVLLNSDESVRRLKGDGRPVQRAVDRASVLTAIDVVDAVTVFDETTPERALADLRPDVFVKGGDYAGVELPEQRMLAGWGGQVVVVPYLAGRSTTRLLQRTDVLRGGTQHG